MPATDAAKQWEGWGTALKPACELIVLARKPLSEGTVAANVLRWGTGAINIAACRVEGQAKPFGNGTARTAGIMGESEPRGAWESTASGRWPANVITDGSEEVIAAFPETTTGDLNRANITAENQIYGARPKELHGLHSGDSGCAARYFYTAKADSDDRLGSKHPTVKPLDLIQYLVRLITPPKGICLDPFAGTGTTGEAAWREGMSAVLIEREAEYCADIRRRMMLVLAGPDERTRESIKAKNLPRDDGPLFDWLQSNEYDGTDDFARSIDDCYRAIRERKAAGGKGWPE
jgi:site-specific DNA-methyltransferase (adenine-specific)